MKIVIHENASKKIAEVIANTVLIHSSQDALDLLLGVSYEHGANKVILHQANITPVFFDLKTRIAGEILQKVVNYRMQVAIVGNFENVTSESLRAFILESNRGKQNFFVNDLASAKRILFEKDL